MRMMFCAGLAGMAARALAIVQAAGQRPPENVPIRLPVRLVAIHARHRPAPVTVTEEMIALVTERANAAIHMVGVFPEQRQLEREVIVQGHSGEISFFTQHFLGGMTLETNLDGGIFGKRGELWHAEIGVGLEPG